MSDGDVNHLTASGLQPGIRIIDRIARTEGGPFTDHGRPADFLLRTRDRTMTKLTPTTCSQFEALLAAIKATLT